MSNFFTELRRRKVYRIAAAYCVAAWLVIQICATIFPIWEMPIWTLRLAIVLVLSGFPLALLLGWVFELTPTGIRHTPDVPVSSAAAKTKRKLRLFGLAGIGLLVSLVAGILILPRAVVRRVEKSIAVLPFENFSDSKENAYFADGIQDDILTNLSKISDLKVISRTSVMSYRGSPKGVKQIAKALGVSTILEGSVQRDKENRVRVNVQLIDAFNDRHLWAQVYDRELTDVFAIQSELAQKIASALKAKLSADEQQRIETKPTQNTEAYLLNLKAHEIFNRPDRHHDDVARAEHLYEKAIELDRSFALAYARLSHLESWMYYAIEASPIHMQKARNAAAEALRLQPNLAEAHLAMGLVYYYLDRDYDRALREMAIARDDLPNDAMIERIVAAIERRQGRWQESTASYRKAAALDPKDPILLENMGWNFLAMRNYSEAAATFDRAVQTAPDTFTIRELRARVDFYARGDLDQMGKLLAAWPETPDVNGTIILTRYNYESCRRNFAPLLRFLRQSRSETSRGETSAPIPNSFLQANVCAFMKDEKNAKANYEEARSFIEPKVRENPADGPRHALLGLIYAGLGRCAEAVEEGKRAVELLPETRDAFDGPILSVSLARIYVKCGDADAALDILQRSLEIPAGITVSELRFDPSWDPLRGHARFQQMLAKHGTNQK